MQSEVRRWVNEGHHVRVFAPGPVERVCPGNPALHWLRGGSAFGWPGLVARVREAPWRSAYVTAFLWQTRRALLHYDYDELVLHWLLAAALFVVPTEKLARSVIVVHGSDARQLSLLPRPLASGVLARLCAAGARFRCVSYALQAELARLCPAVAAHSEVLPTELELPPIERQGLRARLAVPEDAFVAVVVGRLIASKRVDVALTRAPVPSGTHWVVVGDGPLLEPLRERFGSVRFTGALPRDQALQWIAASNVLVSASLEEGAPTAIREARALGTEVWTAAVGDVARWAADDPGISIRPELE